ncbi:MAG: ribosome silencing factor [Phycisphaerales bacterium]
MPTPTQSTKPSVKNAAREAAIAIARVLHDDKCTDIAVLDVTGMSSVSDFIVIASGTSDRQMRSASDDAAQAAEGLGYPAFRRNVDDRTTWVVLDCVDVIAHIFEPNTRAHYDLEMLWGDAPRVPWERADQVSRDRTGLRST